MPHLPSPSIPSSASPYQAKEPPLSIERHTTMAAACWPQQCCQKVQRCAGNRCRGPPPIRPSRPDAAMEADCHCSPQRCSGVAFAVAVTAASSLPLPGEGGSAAPTGQLHMLHKSWRSGAPMLICRTARAAAIRQLCPVGRCTTLCRCCCCCPGCCLCLWCCCCCHRSKDP